MKKTKVKSKTKKINNITRGQQTFEYVLILMGIVIAVVIAVLFLKQVFQNNVAGNLVTLQVNSYGNLSSAVLGNYLPVVPQNYIWINNITYNSAYIVNNSNLVKINYTNGNIQTILNTTNTSAMEYALFDSQNNLWTYNGSGITEINPSNGSIINSKVGCFGEFVIVNNELWTSCNNNDYLIEYSTSNLSMINNITVNGGPSITSVGVVSTDIYGDVWFSTGTSQIGKLNPSTNTYQIFNATTSPYGTLAFYQDDGHGSMFVAANGNPQVIYQLNESTGIIIGNITDLTQFVNASNMGDVSINQLGIGINYNLLVSEQISSSAGQPFSANTMQIFNTTNETLMDNYTTPDQYVEITTDPNGNIWSGGNNGYYENSGTNGTLLASYPSASGSVIYQVLTGKD